MAGHADPPDGTPEGTPDGHSGGDDEYRSVVFDESFVRAARLQEFSARERMGDRRRAVRVRGARSASAVSRGSGSRQLLALFVLLALAFGTAVYLGFREPYRLPTQSRSTGPRMTVVPLTPTGAVPGGKPADLLVHSPAAGFAVGAKGITLPGGIGPTGAFSAGDVRLALNLARDYLIASSLDTDVLAGHEREPVRALLDRKQVPLFDHTFAGAIDSTDEQAVPAGWLVAFDPGKVRQVAGATRVHGSLRYRETADEALEVTSDHTFVYTLRPVGPAAADGASLFTIRRELHFLFDRDNLTDRRVHLADSETGAGPEACSAATTKTFAPLLAGGRVPSDSSVGVNPFAPGPLAGELCGVLGNGAQPRAASSAG